MSITVCIYYYEHKTLISHISPFYPNQPEVWAYQCCIEKTKKDILTSFNRIVGLPTLHLCNHLRSAVPKESKSHKVSSTAGTDNSGKLTNFYNSWVYFLQEKFDAFSNFKRWCKHVERESRNLVELHSDQGIVVEYLAYNMCRICMLSILQLF